MRDLIHPQIISEVEFIKLMTIKLKNNQNLNENDYKFIDIIYILLDKINNSKRLEYHYLNLRSWLKIEKYIDELEPELDNNSIFCRIIYYILTDKKLENYDDCISHLEFKRLNDIGFKMNYLDCLNFKGVLDYQMFEKHMKSNIVNHKIL